MIPMTCIRFMKENGYLDGETLQDTRFGQILQDKMIGTFTRDELEFFENLFDTKEDTGETAIADRICASLFSGNI